MGGRQNYRALLLNSTSCTQGLFGTQRPIPRADNRPHLRVLSKDMGNKGRPLGIDLEVGPNTHSDTLWAAVKNLKLRSQLRKPITGAISPFW